MFISFTFARFSVGFVLKSVDIGVDHFFKQVVTVELTDQRSGIFVVCDVCGVFGNDVSHYLRDGVVATLSDGIADRQKQFFGLHVSVGDDDGDAFCFNNYKI